ncbi:ABC-2 type transport system ATP-binding protein [Micromonospora purpureochromogenes]|uniref:ABC-2 type transport system ATP-binding protein n=1 Tax=Micromonospora purpureochromogenes TaxID=47872 RepID=A0A1C4VCS5_9ACTN|nr:alpha/beta fold hydrolase [Micromonospora purpureochromogenes]SCE81833.1 ABC-2 type transport system ATP-binding protein [Micromonospora purpureochromogenes]
MRSPLSAARLRRVLASRRRVAVASVVVVLLAAAAGWAARPDRPGFRTESALVTVRSGPAGDQPVELDTTLWLPDDASADRRVPAVLLAHGFGGTKDSVRSDAEDLVTRGYAVLTWTARGFGRSGGEIHLDHPDYEIRDAQRLLDRLAERPEIRTDAAGDPRVGVVGGSYGGGLALLLAAQDQRVDAIVPMITWNDLSRAFLPESTGRAATDGVFKKGWAGIFFGGGGNAGSGPAGLSGTSAAQPEGAPASAGPASPAPGAGPGTGPRSGPAPAADPSCGRFTADVCAAYLRIATAGRADQAAVELLRRSSPAGVLDRIKAPTLLVQGEADTLFPLTEADANARGIAAAGTPVRVAWFTGGHDGGTGPTSDSDRVKFLTAQWLDHYVKGAGAAPGDGFTFSRIAGFDALDRGLVATGYRTADYPGVAGDARREIAVTGPAQPIANPPNGNPAAISSVPFAGALGSLLGGVAGDVPGQHARFESAPLADAVDVAGSPTFALRAASPTGEAVLFVKLYDVDPNGAATLPDGLVAPVRLTGLPKSLDGARPVTVTLPAIVRRIEAGHRLRVVVATSDQAYTTPAEPTVYTVAAGDAPVSLPTVDAEPIPTTATVWRWVLVGLLAAIAVGLAVVVAVARRRHRRQDSSVHPEYAGVPLAVRQLRKEYADGFVAVSNVDFEVHPGQVVGLLGPNGAGKTTTLRVLMGLTQPTAGEIYVFGHRLVPGSPVLSRIGALVEGPGFLPHLSGLENLKAYWRATGRPAADAHFEEALEIAGLGDSVHRRIRNYSHGMKQRLAIAQAMLGLPELLVLDEPTDGLDPPQIAEMRRVLQRYATDGRAVLVSSHLLAEVEQTCTHAVVVNKGRIVASGPVEEIVGDSPSVLFDVTDPAAARVVLDRLAGVRVLPDGDGGLVVDTNGTARSEVVAELVRAGIGVDRVVPRRRLEDAFLALVGENSRGSGDR